MRTFVKQVKQRAQEALKPHLECARADHLSMSPVYALRIYHWEEHIKVGPSVGQREIIEANQRFDLGGCFGRTVLGTLIAEKRHARSILVCEVVKDALAVRMMEKLSSELDPVARREIAGELLMYEEPHTVIQVDGEQFDPLSVILNRKLVHPSVLAHNPWDAIAASLVVDEALMENNLVARDIHLQRAEVICPHMRLVRQNRIAVAVAMGDSSGRKLCEEFLEEGMNARVLYMMYRAYDCQDIHNEYPAEVFEILDQEYSASASHVMDGGVR